MSKLTCTTVTAAPNAVFLLTEKNAPSNGANPSALDNLLAIVSAPNATPAGVAAAVQKFSSAEPNAAFKQLGVDFAAYGNGPVPTNVPPIRSVWQHPTMERACCLILVREQDGMFEIAGRQGMRSALIVYPGNGADLKPAAVQLLTDAGSITTVKFFGVDNYNVFGDVDIGRTADDVLPEYEHVRQHILSLCGCSALKS